MKSSISKNTISIILKSIATLFLIAVVVANIFIWSGNLGKHKEIDALMLEINEVTQKMAQTPEPPSNLEQKLAAAQAELLAVENDFPSSLNSTAIINDVLVLADLYQIKAIPLSTQAWAMDSGYYVFKFHITATGSLLQIEKFLSRLEKGLYETLAIEGFSVTRRNKPQEDGTDLNEVIPVTASLDIAIYMLPLFTD